MRTIFACDYLGPERTRFPIARLRSPRPAGRSHCTGATATLRFHAYDRIRSSANVDELLTEIDCDPTGIVWG
jgi:hypothetical protein